MFVYTYGHLWHSNNMNNRIMITAGGNLWCTKYFKTNSKYKTISSFDSLLFRMCLVFCLYFVIIFFFFFLFRLSLRLSFCRPNLVPFLDAYFTFHSEFSIWQWLNGYCLWLFEWEKHAGLNALSLSLRCCCVAVELKLQIHFHLLLSRRLKHEYDAKRFEMQYGQSPGKLKITPFPIQI